MSTDTFVPSEKIDEITVFLCESSGSVNNDHEIVQETTKCSVDFLPAPVFNEGATSSVDLSEGPAFTSSTTEGIYEPPAWNLGPPPVAERLVRTYFNDFRHQVRFALKLFEEHVQLAHSDMVLQISEDAYNQAAKERMTTKWKESTEEHETIYRESMSHGYQAGWKFAEEDQRQGQRLLPVDRAFQAACEDGFSKNSLATVKKLVLSGDDEGLAQELVNLTKRSARESLVKAKASIVDRAVYERGYQLGRWERYEGREVSGDVEERMLG